MRISGFASGMDIDQIVKDLMKVERMPLDRFYQRRTTLEWQRDNYRDMNKLLTNFRELSTSLTRSATLGAKTVGSSNGSIATATASSSAAYGTYKLEDIKLATAASNISDGKLSANSSEKIDSAKSLWSQKDLFTSPDFGDPSNSTIWKEKEFSQGEITLSTSTNTVRLAKGALVDSTLPGEVKVTSGTGEELTTETFVRVASSENLADNEVFINPDTGEMTFGKQLDKGSKVEGFTYNHQYFDFTITSFDANGEAKTFSQEFEGSMTLNQVLSAINSSSVGVNALYDSHSDQVVFSRKETGNFSDGNEMRFSEGFLTQVLKMNETKETGGTDSTFKINGLETSRKSNTFTMNGMTITLKGNTVGTNEAVNLTVSQNTDLAFDEIKKFVDTYNELVDTISGKINERKNRGFPPLTEEQKRDLSDREIELWEEKAKSGMLQNDPALRGALDQLRRELYNVVEGVDPAFNQLAKIGITTSRDFRENGKLVIDDAKLREAIASNPEDVMNLFRKSGTNRSESGLAQRMRQIADNTIKSIESRAGNQYRTNQQFTLGRELIDVEKRISDFERRLSGIENRYWSQFTAMEKALSQMNNQANYMYQQFSSF